MATVKMNEKSQRQYHEFVDAARALECDESEERFNAALGKIVRHKPAAEHWSDCAVYNEPALPAGPCDCGGFKSGK